jgi:hypothetical protein
MSGVREDEAEIRALAAAWSVGQPRTRYTEILCEEKRKSGRGAGLQETDAVTSA